MGMVTATTKDCHGLRRSTLQSHGTDSVGWPLQRWELASGSDPNDTCDPFEGDADGDGLCDHLRHHWLLCEDPCSMVKTRMETDLDILETLEGWDADNACSRRQDLDGTDGVTVWSGPS